MVVPVGTAMRMFDRRSLFRIFVEVPGRPTSSGQSRRVILALFVERHDGEEDVTVLTQDAVRRPPSRRSWAP